MGHKSSADPGEGGASGSRGSLRAALEHAAHLLPAQGPISVFIHHNTLHAFEDEPFEDAVVRAGQILGCASFLEEGQYRAELARGRILEGDVDGVVEQVFDGDGDAVVAAHVTRRDLWRRVLLYGYTEASGPALQWLISETDVVRTLRRDIPGDAKEVLFSWGGEAPEVHDEELVASRLWHACLDAVARSRFSLLRAPVARGRARDILLDPCGIDIDDWVHPVLIRFVAAFLDQGLADWPMPERDQGLYECFLAIFGRPIAIGSGPWAADLKRLIIEERGSERDAWSSLENSLAVLGVESSDYEGYVTAEALALRGWAGMVHQVEVRPDRVPVLAIPARLVDYMAIRLLLVRATAQYALRRAGRGWSLAELRTNVSFQAAADDPPLTDRAWLLFQVAQLCGLGLSTIEALPESEVTALEVEIATLDSPMRRRIFHLAYERHLRHRYYDALVQHSRQSPSLRPTFQAVFCLDEREESFRRHLEEVEPLVETFGTAGFFGVAMYYRGVTDAHARPLCPVAIKPQHYVSEGIDSGGGAPIGPHERAWRGVRSLVNKNVHFGSRRLGRGAVLMATFGVMALVPLVLRVLFPWGRRAGRFLRRSDRPGTLARLQVARVPGPAPLGEYVGFEVTEMADIVLGQLRPLGIEDRMARLVLVIGHGSTSLNNPQESAHDCGACGGGRGGPNARAFAQMANDPKVRALLESRGMIIPPQTWFVAGERNTANNDVTLFDTDLVPDGVREVLTHAKSVLDRARSREAHERSRRFDAAPRWLPPQGALFHVQMRAEDLAQPRPEYGHATNAFCLIGRRMRTRSLFLDRRAFLVSYDCTKDPDGASLARLLAAVTPVVAGISLEYLFGYIDPTGYGSGTKLPHNVTGMVGVMDGASSDLRPGLPWQMLEIHEPVRLTIVVETMPEVLQAIISSDPGIQRLVSNRWVYFAALDPDSSRLWELEAFGMRSYQYERPLETVVGHSREHYQGKRGHLPFVAITPSKQAGA